MLLAINFDKDLVDIEGLAIAPLLSIQTAGSKWSEFGASEANRLAADDSTPFGQQIVDEWSSIPALAQIETIVGPDGIGI